MSKETHTCQIHKKYDGIKCDMPILTGDPDGFCIFHSQDKSKDIEAFQKAIHSKLKKDSEFDDFRGFFFPCSFDPSFFPWIREFEKIVDFSFATFAGDVSFPGTIFKKRASFMGVNFNEDTSFIFANFIEQADFSFVNFMKIADFDQVNFTEGADFYGTNFEGKATFYIVKFNKGTTFREATFKKDTNFFNSFIDGVNFVDTLFIEKSDFVGVIFSGRVAFMSAIFNKYTNFYNTKFNNGASFSGAHFKEEVNFRHSVFEEETYFGGSIFEGGADFTLAVIAKKITFHMARMHCPVTFSSINQLQEGKPPPPVFQADFRNLELEPGAVLRFQDMSLANVLFAGTDLRIVEFINVAWHRFGGRDIIYDEKIIYFKEIDYLSVVMINQILYRIHNNPLNRMIMEILTIKIAESLLISRIYKRGSYLLKNMNTKLLEGLYNNKPKSEEYARVEELYRYLKINYEEKADFKKSGDFHYGEMEMYRKANPFRRGIIFSWYNLYKILSGYGERPIRALSFLIIFLALFTGCLSSFGLEILDPKHIPSFGDSFFYLLQKVTLQRPTWAEPMGFWGKLVAGLSVIFIPGQAALFLLALRNRLGRRR